VYERDGKLYIPTSTGGGDGRPVPLAFLLKLQAIDRRLTCEWHDFYEKYMVIRKLSDRVQDVLIAVDYDHLWGNEALVLLREIREAYTNRDPKEKVAADQETNEKRVAAEKKPALDAIEGIVTREVDASQPGYRSHALGAPGEPAPGHPLRDSDNRLQGMIGKD
jgi:hypothetical protein